jgi:hypothetical protein
MSEIAPESLVQTWLGDQCDAASAAIFGQPFYVPYDHLAGVNGWTLWLGHPPVPDALTLLPAPEELLWGEPESAIATAMLVAADYAIRRGANDLPSARAILDRESPIAIVVPDLVHPSLEVILVRAARAGLQVVNRRIATVDELATIVPTFRRRREAHAVNLGRGHDPALSFQERVSDVVIGGNPLSSFVVHNEPERDDVTVTGELSERIGIEIGVAGPEITVEATKVIEDLAATFPSFVDGITSARSDHSLAIGWREGDSPQPLIIGEAFRTWLKALCGASIVDVRIAFASERGASALLTDIRARASAFRRYRDAVMAGVPGQSVPAAVDTRIDAD